jgi:hypothetical protein
MKLLLTAAAFAATLGLSAQSIEKNVEHFNKVIASPKINIVLVRGDHESVKINYSGVDQSRINVVVRNKTLRIYLDKSKFAEKREWVKQDGWEQKRSVYRDANITAYVTYKHLDKLVVRGESVADIQSEIDNSKFKLTGYGECEITIYSLRTDKFKAALYGDNSLKIKSGEVGYQKYKLFGDNKIDSQSITGHEVTSTTYGDSNLRLNASEYVRLNTIGESDVIVKGSPDLNKFTLGQVSVRK